MKRALALVLALLMACSVLFGCSQEPDTSYIISVKKDGETVEYPVEPYRYYLQWLRDFWYANIAAMTSGASNVPSWEELLARTDFTAPQTLSQSIISTAQDQYMTYLYAEETFKELGLTLTAEDEKAIDELIQKDWVSVYGHDRFNSIRKTLGMTYDEFRNLMACNIKSERIVQHYYGKGGESEITEDAMKQRFENYYVRFKYVIFMTRDSDGNKFGDAKMTEIKAKRDAALAELEAGTSFEDVLVKYSEDYTDITDSKLTSAQKAEYEAQNLKMKEDGLVMNDKGIFDERLANYYNISVDEDVVEAVFAMKEGDVETVTIDDSIWIVKKYSVHEKDEYFEGVREQIFKELYADDLAARHTRWRQSLDYTYTPAALDFYAPKNLADLFDLASVSGLTGGSSSGSSASKP